MRHTDKHLIIRDAVRQNPQLSTRAIAKLTTTSQATVAKVRAVTGTPFRRREASGKRARGPRPLVQNHADRLPDGGGILYRCFDRHNGLLFIGTSFDFILRLTSLSHPPWHRQIHHTNHTHYRSLDEALAAEIEAIRREQPRYDTAPRRDPTAPRRAVQAGRTGSHTVGVGRATAPSDTPADANLIRRPTGRVPV